jgi:hypothetical protein
MTEKKDNKRTWQEEFKVSGSELIDKIKELVHEGNIRRIILKNEEGKTMLEIPLTLGLVGAALAPVLAAVGAVAALVAKLTIVVEKDEEPESGEEKGEEEKEEGEKEEGKKE